VCSLFADDVDDIVDGDTTEQAASGVDDGSRDEVALLEESRYIVCGHIGFDAWRIGIEAIADRVFWVSRDDTGEQDRAEVTIVTIDDKETIGA
jgi:hypothetical protein